LAPVKRVEVKKGETIDFVVDCRENPDTDSYQWSPVVRVLDAPAAGAEAAEWNAAADFSGPREAASKLSPWEKYAQVLLMSDEFMFVD